MEFSYFMPVRLLFGANVIDQLGATAKSYGTHALIADGPQQHETLRSAGPLHRPAGGRGRPRHGIQ